MGLCSHTRHSAQKVTGAAPFDSTTASTSRRGHLFRFTEDGTKGQSSHRTRPQPQSSGVAGWGRGRPTLYPASHPTSGNAGRTPWDGAMWRHILVREAIAKSTRAATAGHCLRAPGHTHTAHRIAAQIHDVEKSLAPGSGGCLHLQTAVGRTTDNAPLGTPTSRDSPRPSCLLSRPLESPPTQKPCSNPRPALPGLQRCPLGMLSTGPASDSALSQGHIR